MIPIQNWFADRFAPGPLFIWVCVIGLAIVPLVWFGARSARRARVRYSVVAAVTRLSRTWALRVRWLIPLLRTAALLALIVAIARPQAGGAFRDTSEGIAIQMVMDISGSMAETDFKMDGQWVRRLDAVKQVFHEFVLGGGRLSGRSNDLIGMTTFAMYVDTPCPLTRDHASLDNFLKETEIPGWVRGVRRADHPEANFTSMGEALAVATDDMRRAGEQAASGVPGAAPAKSRVMILLTDGANNPPPDARRVAPEPLDAAQVAAKLGIRVYTIGAVGSQDEPMQDFMLFPVRRAQFDESVLQQIAAITGGQYFRAKDAQSLATIYEEIDKLERQSTGERVYRDDVRAATIAMTVALACVMAELFLINTRFRRVP